jgi:hypothetical protein
VACKKGETYLQSEITGIDSHCKGKTKCLSYETLQRPIITYGSECWPLLQKVGNMLRIFERILKMIYRPVINNGIWTKRHSTELHMHYD